eukprot:gnl/MRDRNA2_/MRDRNA2_84157_c0_seq1.p1 gnl/MRDRNA2_/MRDRNA2_84157_c0~~gnl/MRDRNA2_/MRDRNA2_84157_c0_seq1.p1  ORF type:complete len:630 (-),score=235.44 gnl/MRDRNA2_/MRDRNA2_84157_c0_seq1:30-1919(-)
MTEAAAGTDAAALRTAIEAAVAAGVSSEEVQSGKKTLWLMEVNEALDDAIMAQDVEALQDAIDEAESVGADAKGKIEEAKALLSKLQNDDDPHYAEAAQLVEETKAKVAELKNDAEKGKNKKVKDAAMKEIKSLESNPEYVQALRYMEDPITARAVRQEQERNAAVARFEEAIAAKNVDQAMEALHAVDALGINVDIFMGELDDLRGQVAKEELEVAVSSNEIDTLQRAIEKAESEDLPSLEQDLTEAKETLHRLREEAQKDAGPAAAALPDAIASDDIATLLAAIKRAEKACVDKEKIAPAKKALFALEKAKKEAARKAKRQEEALEAALKALEGDDINVATVAVDHAEAEGCEQAAELQEKLSDLRMRIDPEGEKRRRRVAERRKKDTKWNYGGKSDNPLINDRFREHEVEMEQRRLLAFKGRGKFRNSAEDEGEEKAEGEVKKLRAEVAKEEGYVPLPQLATRKGFKYQPNPEENQPQRNLKLKVHEDYGAGIEMHPTWYGMQVDEIEDLPGQPGLRTNDFIVVCGGASLTEMDDDACESAFTEAFGDGVEVVVEGWVESLAYFPAEQYDKDSLLADLERFSADYAVQVEFTSATEMKVCGCQTAVKTAKPELAKMMEFYFPPGPS